MPRISGEQKARNREKIVAAAGERFRTRGIDAVGIDEVMSAAGMTHGGFYNHFTSKKDLAIEVLHQGFTDSLGDVDTIVGDHPQSAAAALEGIIDTYLTAAHRDHPETGCASATLAVDAARHGIDAQTEYVRGLDGYLSTIAKLIGAADRSDGADDPARAREAAIALFSQMVGALIISRAVVSAAPRLSDEIIASARRHALRG